MHDRKLDVINDVKSILEYYQALGFDSLPISSRFPDDSHIEFSAGKKEMLINLREEIGDCHRCKLDRGRKILLSVQAMRTQG